MAWAIGIAVILEESVAPAIGVAVILEEFVAWAIGIAVILEEFVAWAIGIAVILEKIGPLPSETSVFLEKFVTYGCISREIRASALGHHHLHRRFFTFQTFSSVTARPHREH